LVALARTTSSARHGVRYIAGAQGLHGSRNRALGPASFRKTRVQIRSMSSGASFTHSAHSADVLHDEGATDGIANKKAAGRTSSSSENFALQPTHMGLRVGRFAHQFESALRSNALLIVADASIKCVSMWPRATSRRKFEIEDLRSCRPIVGSGILTLSHG
jgi:hypothetical protein